MLEEEDNGIYYNQAKYGFDYAAKLLGLNKQSENPKYTIGMPFTNNKININPENGR